MPIGGALTAVLMALVHVGLSLPPSAFTLALHVGLRSAASAEMLGAIFDAQQACITVLSLGTLADFIIYYSRIRAFREALAATCKCSRTYD